MKLLIKEAAYSVGFDACGIARAEALPNDAALLNAYLAAGKHGDMSYLSRETEKRTNPQILVPDCRSVVVALLNYKPERIQEPHLPQIGKYAYSATDYHLVMKEKLLLLESKLIELLDNKCVSESHQHRFVDTAPILEKRWAQRAGLGWIGRHSQLIHPSLGSYTFIGIILLQTELEDYDSPLAYRCGTCQKCIRACPTGALVDGETMDARKCIAYQTLEAKTPIPSTLLARFSGYIAGCDICSNVCPWNKRFSVPHQHAALRPTPHIFSLTRHHWMEMTETTFQSLFRHSAVRRAGLQRIQGIIKNEQPPHSSEGCSM